jgi:DNA-binding transcriptional ArsR family regulator
MTSRKQSKGTSLQREGRFAYEGLDRVLHEKARLSIMTSLTTQPEGLSFLDLRTLCALSDGNLNRHLAVLQDAGFVKIEKEGRGRNSRSFCQVTRAGRAAFLQYLQELDRVLADAAGTEEKPVRSAEKLRPGWTAS